MSMKCQNGTCEHTAHAATLSGLRKDNTALREELAALRAGNELLPLAPVMLSDSLLDVLESESSAQSLAKVRADAIRDALYQWEHCSDKNIRVNLEYHASQIEAGL